MTILSATIGPIIQTHTVVLLKNDTDQMIVIPLFDENGDQYTGSVTNLGVNFILNGGTDVTHGLAAAPTRVLLSPTTATGGKDFYVSAKDATTFTITIDSAHSADISFDWQAMI